MLYKTVCDYRFFSFRATLVLFKGVAMSKIKKLCALKKSDIEENTKKLFKIVSKPKFICTKCARVSKDEKHLCHASSLKKP